ncbi:MAG: adenylosuccinate lyase [bacterium]|nr:adenylosuccinate lyase [bacterium]
MIERYTTKEFKNFWTEEYKYKKWLEVEIAVLDAYVKLGKIPAGVVTAIKKKAKINIQRINELELITQHDLIAFLESLKESVGTDAKWIHMGLTSYDIEDTALALLLKESGEIILKELESLLDVIKKRAKEEKYTLIAGRTHGIQAEPISVGLKFLVWYDEALRNKRRLLSAIETISYGKISGACGNYPHITPELERLVCKNLGLKPAPISTQIIQRDNHAEFILALAMIATSCEKTAQEIRHLQRTEIHELEEPFGSGQKGSSAMPHKKNPVICERICGLARVIRANSMAAMQNIPLWGERDISNSSSERIIIPDSIMLTHYMLRKTKDVISGLKIINKNLEKNLELTRGQIFSGRILKEFLAKGIERETAYKIVQSSAFRAEAENKHLRDILLEDKLVKKTFSAKAVTDFFNPKYYLRWVDYIFDAVFKQ